jgi:hypothetical protein
MVKRNLSRQRGISILAGRDSIIENHMNKPQKIALLVAALVLMFTLGKTVTKIGFKAIGALTVFFWKGIIVVVSTLFVLSLFKKAGKKK